MKITFLFIFLIMFIVLALFVLLYYLLIKKSKKIPIILGENSKYPDLNSMTIVYNSLLCWILLIVNKITKRNYTSITNPLSNKIHFINKEDYLDPNLILIRHEYIHLIQSKYEGKIKFLIEYFAYWMKKKISHFDIPYEKMAYRYESLEVDYSKLQEIIFEECEKLKNNWR